MLHITNLPVSLRLTLYIILRYSFQKQEYISDLYKERQITEWLWENTISYQKTFSKIHSWILLPGIHAGIDLGVHELSGENVLREDRTSGI